MAYGSTKNLYSFAKFPNLFTGSVRESPIIASSRKYTVQNNVFLIINEILSKFLPRKKDTVYPTSVEPDE